MDFAHRVHTLDSKDGPLPVRRLIKLYTLVGTDFCIKKKKTKLKGIYCYSITKCCWKLEKQGRGLLLTVSCMSHSKRGTQSPLLYPCLYDRFRSL